MREHALGFFRREGGTNDRHHIDDCRQQQEDLEGIVNEEIKCFTRTGTGYETNDGENYIVGKVF